LVAGDREPTCPVFSLIDILGYLLNNPEVLEEKNAINISKRSPRSSVNRNLEDTGNPRRKFYNPKYKASY
jgi:hypothetical protein